MKQGWEIKKLGEITEQINGLWIGKNPPFVTIAVIRNTNFTKDCNLDTNNIAYIQVEQKQYSTRKLKCGDIIIEKSGGSDKQPVGRPILFNIEDGEYSFSNFTSVLRVVDNTLISPKFLHKFLVYAYNQGYTLNMQSKTTGIRNLNFKLYKNMNVPVPERAEQERIVGELDCLSGIIAAKRAQLRELDTLAQSIFYTMFGDPITNDKGWQTKKLSEISSIVGGSTPLTKDEKNWNGDLNWVTPAELNGTLYYGETQRKITTEGARGLELLPVGTVLLSSRAPIGKLAITTVPMYCNQGFKNVVCGESINNIYVYYYLLATIENVKALGVGATFKEVSKRAVENYHILVPPIDLQQQFAEKIENIERQKELITKSIKETEDLFNSRMSYYFD